MLDGPFVESKEQLAGYYLIDAPDLDAAMQMGRPMPAERSMAIVEVRAIWAM